MNMLFILITLAALGALAYHHATRQSAVMTLAAIALTALLLDGVSTWFTAPLILVTATALALGHRDLRQRFITEPVLVWFRRTLPALSETEQAALDAGTVWWDRELFSGDPDWQRLLKTPPAHLTREEQAFLDGPVETLCAMLDSWQIQQDQDLPEAVWNFLRREGFFGMIIDREYGGLGFSPVANSAVVSKIASRDVTAAVTVMVPNSLGPGELLQHYGTEEQKSEYLPRLADGRDLPCFALTSPVAGSDAGSMADTGVICHGEWNGERVLGFRLNWDKRYITLAPVATLLGLAFKARDPDGLLGKTEELGITCALVPTNLPGITIGRRHRPSGAAFMNGPTQGTNVFVPLNAVIGGPERIGQGWSMLVQSLAAGRAISLPALGVAGSKMAAHATGAYARIRRQFKMPIGYFEGVEEVLGRLAGNVYRDDATRLLTLLALQIGEQPSVLTAIAKAYLTESNRQAVNDAMDVHGGKGIMQGPRNYLQSAYQVLPIGITVEGANILTRSMIIFGQGAIRAHPHILREMRSAQAVDDPASLRAFDAAFFDHVAFTLSNFVRTFWMGITGARLVQAPVAGPTAHYYRQLTRMSSAFAFLADVVLLVLGGNFKFREKLSGRLADVLAHLYMASAALKRFEDNGRPEDELPLLNWALRDSLFVIQERLFGVIRNFPVWWLRRILRMIVFPLGMFYRAPSDNLGKRAARLLLRPGAVRDRLLAGLYLTDDGPGLAELNRAFDAVVAAEPAEKRLRALTQEVATPANVEALLAQALATGEFSTDEAALVRKAQQAVALVIAVDDFPQTSGDSSIQAGAQRGNPAAAAPRPDQGSASAEQPVQDAIGESGNPAPPLGGTGDDLTRIRGIGPKFRRELASLGYTRFRQIAALTEAEIERIETHIGFPGRIARERWQTQAAELQQPEL